MLDFMGHDLRVGDVVIAPEPDNTAFFLARVVAIQPSQMASNVEVVNVQPLAEHASKRHTFAYDGIQIMWYASDYHGVPDSYVWALLGANHR